MNCKFDVIIYLDFMSWILCDFDKVALCKTEGGKIRVLTREIPKFNHYYDACNDPEKRQAAKEKIKLLNECISDKTVSYIGKQNDSMEEVQIYDMLLKNYNTRNILFLAEEKEPYGRIELFKPIFSCFGKELALLSSSEINGGERSLPTEEPAAEQTSVPDEVSPLPQTQEGDEAPAETSDDMPKDDASEETATDSAEKDGCASEETADADAEKDGQSSDEEQEPEQDEFDF